MLYTWPHEIRTKITSWGDLKVNNVFSYPFKVLYSDVVNDDICYYNDTGLPYNPFSCNRETKNGFTEIDTPIIYDDHSIAFGNTIKGYGAYRWDDYYVDLDSNRDSKFGAFNFVGSKTSPMTYDEMYRYIECSYSFFNSYYVFIK